MSITIMSSPLVATIAPKTMLYRAAEEPNPELWDLKLAHAIVADADVDAALADGWYRHPTDVAAAEAAAEAKAKAEADAAAKAAAKAAAAAKTEGAKE